MKASDTVMNEQQKINAMGIASYKASYALDALCKTQVEISFNAGIKEVIPYAEKFLALTRHGDPIDGELYNTYRKQWQSKLKEWGIK